MSKKYGENTIEELQAMLLNGELIREDIESEDYAIIIETELEKTEPNNEVIRLCANALDNYDQYKELDQINIDVSELIKSYNASNKPIKFKKRKRILIFVAAITAAVLALQLVSVALGFDLFGYVFNWEKERIVVTYNGEKSEEPDIYETYDNLSDVPSDAVSLVPNFLIQEYEFFFASTDYQRNGGFSHSFAFKFDEDIYLLLSIRKDFSAQTTIQKDDEYYEEYSVNDKDYTLYKNLDQYKALWFEDGIMYDMGLITLLDEFKEIINHF